MTLLLSCQGICKSFGSKSLFKELSFGLFKGDKVGLIGPNGSGKSTLLKILTGLESPDEGTIAGNRTLRVGYVAQDAVFPNKTLTEIVVDALSGDHTLSHYEKVTKASIILSKLGFPDPDQKAESLSGGWKKRLDIAREVVKSPDILFLDEPTNHLDLEGILWLEKYLNNAPFAYLIISHDRYFLENVTTRMMELNKTYPKGLFTVDGSYSAFIEKREEFLSGQQQQERSLASKVRREVEWLKQNPKARTVKSSARVQEAHSLIQDLSELKGRNKTSQNQIDFVGSERQTQKFLVATNVGKSMGERQLFAHLNFTLSPGVRLGIVGLNGSGKTTLLRLLTGEILPDQGTIKYADGIKIVYFDQHRVSLPSDTTLRRALAPEGDTVIYRGRSIHVNAWCKRFLFTPDRLDLPFGQLSGGEKARVHIARLMLKPADILLLDEPTNDLDIPTLEILEESLVEFPGALVMISHDRYMLDQISNVILGLGGGTEGGLFADYRQWEKFQADEQEKKQLEINIKKTNPAKANVDTTANEIKPKKMTFAEKHEWEKIEGKILLVEKEIEVFHQLLQDPKITDDMEKMQEICEKLGEKQKEHDALFARWEELESLK
ncbi:MAG: ABC-F family ATP-binding cassette domain-containing protein [Parachlamydiaceae bacterium]|nr:ABC-F family ATP-binding cassette domain-containing protein [Parachlamydiaceae bacterium]